MTRVPADEQRLREVREDLRDWPRDDLFYLAQLTVHAADEIDRLLALLRVREQEAGELRERVDGAERQLTVAWSERERSAQAAAVAIKERDSWQETAEVLQDTETMAALYEAEKEERDAAVLEAAELRAAVLDGLTVFADTKWAATYAVLVADPAAEETRR